MIQISKMASFGDWMAGLSDIRLRARIAASIDRMALGNPSDVSLAGEALNRLSIDSDLGYRVFFTRDTVTRNRRSITRIILLCGGDRSLNLRG